MKALPYWYAVRDACHWDCGWVFALSPLEAAEKAIARTRELMSVKSPTRTDLQRYSERYELPCEHFSVIDGRVVYSTDPSIQVEPAS